MATNDTPVFSEREQRLQARFSTALRAVGAADDGTDVFSSLVDLYREPHRHYHNLDHIDACLAWLDWFAGSAQRPAEVELALWFHDVVYDPQRSDNEQRSAEFAARCLGDLDVSDAAIARITQHIVATAHHGTTTGDAALLTDIDLSILGAAPADFDRFEQQVRREYAHVSEEAYRIGRTRVLTNFLSRPQIYATAVVGDLLEAQARNNMERAIQSLTSEGGES